MSAWFQGWAPAKAAANSEDRRRLRPRPILAYRTLSNRVYLAEAVHEGTAYPGEHDAIVTSAQWDAVHAVLQVSPRRG